MTHKLIEKYRARSQAINSLLCVGLDSDFERLPARFHDHETPQFAFNRWIIEQTNHVAAAYKPNIAFYEAHGEQGWRDLKLTVDYLRRKHPDILTICDAKRGDIGNTNAGYVRAIFDDMGFDAITLHPYLGQAALRPFLERSDRISIILCRTSNEGSGEFQTILSNGKPMWQHVAEHVRDEWNANDNCMLVVGATYPSELHQLREIVGDMTLLVPGIGAQGGDVAEAIRAGVDSSGGGMIVNASRSIIFADDPGSAASNLHDTINQYR